MILFGGHDEESKKCLALARALFSSLSIEEKSCLNFVFFWENCTVLFETKVKFLKRISQNLV